MSNRMSVTPLPNPLARREVLVGATIAVGALFFGPTESRAALDEAVSHSAESIHQEITFKATKKRIYDALTNAKQFEQVVHLSDAMKTRMPANAPPDCAWLTLLQVEAASTVANANTAHFPAR